MKKAIAFFLASLAVCGESAAWADEIKSPDVLPPFLSRANRLQFSGERGVLTSASQALAARGATRDAVCAGAASPCRTENIGAQKRAYDMALGSYEIRLRDRRNSRGAAPFIP